MDDLHEGMRVWIEERAGWLPFYACREEWPPETSVVYELCHHWDAKQTLEAEEAKKEESARG